MNMLVPLTDHKEVKQQLEFFEFAPIGSSLLEPKPASEAIEENPAREVVLRVNRESSEEGGATEPPRLSSLQQEMLANGLPIAFGSKKKIRKH